MMDADTSNMLVTLMQKAGPASLGLAKRPSLVSVSILESEFEKLKSAKNLSAKALDSIKALVLLWNDHVVEAHLIAQQISGADGAYIHGLTHRREPDYGNAKYWFHRVGDHPIFTHLAKKIGGMPQVKSSPELRTLIYGGRWNPVYFIDLCEKTELETGAALETTLEAIQQTEFELLLEHLSR